MLNVQNKSKNIGTGDIIAFLINDDFIGYGKVIALHENEALIDEDSSVNSAIERIRSQGGTYNIEIV